MEDQNTTANPNTTTALARLDVDEGHALYTTADGARLARDTDVARWAGLSQPRDIRRTIRSAIDDGAIAAGAAPGDGPSAVEIMEATTGGKGASMMVRTYYLNEAGAIMLATRLRTERAVRLTREIVSTFVAVKRAEAPTSAAPPSPALPLIEERARLLIGIADRLPHGANRDAALSSAAELLGVRAPLARPAPLALPPAVDLAELAKLHPRHEEPSKPSAPAVRLDVAPIAGEWLSPVRLAARLSVALQRQITPQAVGLALTALGFRDRRELFRVELVERTHGAEGEAAVYRWRPDVFGVLHTYFATHAVKRTSPRRAGDHVGRLLEGASAGR